VNFRTTAPHQRPRHRLRIRFRGYVCPSPSTAAAALDGANRTSEGLSSAPKIHLGHTTGPCPIGVGNRETIWRVTKHRISDTTLHGLREMNRKW
jgi:hypothetical protein